MSSVMDLSVSAVSPGNVENAQEPGLHAVLCEARRALDAGRSQQARSLAQQVLSAAKERADLHVEAQALLCLAHCDRLISRLRRACDACRQAALLFRKLGDLDGESSALMTLAHVCTLLGRHEEAVEAAVFSARICESQNFHPQTALAQNYLGIAHGWSGNFDDAQNALSIAARIADRCVPAVSAFQPRMNQAWIEAVRIATERHLTGRRPGLGKLQAMAATLSQMEHAGKAESLQQVSNVVEHTLSALLAGLIQCWEDNLDVARQALERAQTWIRRVDATTWLSAFACWVEGEIAWAAGDWNAAEASLRRMTELAGNVEHEQLACFGHLLVCQILEEQGMHELALAESRKLRRLEQRIRAECLKSRETFVAFQLSARRNEQVLQQLQEKTRLLERWSLEDTLTGIANRRHFERVLSERLGEVGATGRSVSVALIDVDEFKSINDRFTHQVGDRVLKTLAGILSNVVREQDLAARLAGDEFVVMFAQTDPTDAHRISERIRAAVSGYNWASIAPGLRVSVSVGVSQSVETDTVESLLHRSDVAMYQSKPHASERLGAAG